MVSNLGAWYKQEVASKQVEIHTPQQQRKQDKTRQGKPRQGCNRQCEQKGIDSRERYGHTGATGRILYIDLRTSKSIIYFVQITPADHCFPLGVRTCGWVYLVLSLCSCPFRARVTEKPGRFDPSVSSVKPTCDTIQRLAFCTIVWGGNVATFPLRTFSTPHQRT